MINLDCAKLLFADGSRVSPCLVSIGDLDEHVIGRLQGHSFKGEISFKNTTYSATQSGSPYKGNMKLSFPDVADKLATFKFPSGEGMVMILVFANINPNGVKALELFGKNIKLN